MVRALRQGMDEPLPPWAVERAGPDCLPKQAFDIDELFRRLRVHCARLPRAALFELRDRGYARPFELLVAAVISVRTRDEVTIRVAPALLDRARTPEEMLAIPEEELATLLSPATFAETKARHIRQISALLLERHGGCVPSDARALRALPGVGPKVANIVLATAFHQPAIAVDIHVHRITRRWGYTDAPTPEKTEEQLRAKLPREYWVEINERLVPFGKFVCTGQRPRCNDCPLLTLCRQVGVTDHR